MFSPRTLLAAPLFLAFFFTGCGPNVALVENVPPPAFGPRHIGMPPLPPRTVAPPVQAGAWVPPVPERKWRYILIHHSASPTGSAAMFDRAHRERGWNELGYDFVIGNGSLTGDGQVEIGPRWTKQVTGAHAGVRDHPEFNEFGVGICLVGNFDLGRPSAAQMQSLVSLVRWLMHRYDIPKTRVLGHGMLKPTDCPGKEFPWTDFYRRLN